MRFNLVLLAVLIVSVGACTVSDQVDEASDHPAPATGHAPERPEIVIGEGQSLYVPCYSHIYYDRAGKRYPLAVNLNVGNTDPLKAITLQRVDYYSGEGDLIEVFLDEPMTLAPMASTQFFVGQRDMRGGIGANFIVTWSAEEAVHAPMVEAVMIGTAGSLGLSFVSEGRPYDDRVLPKSE